MDAAPPTQPDAPLGAGKPGIPALAITSVVLGILGLLTSPVVVGAFFGLVGAVFGGMHLALRRGARGMAWAGLGLSGAGIVATVAFVGLYFAGARQLTAVPATTQEGGLAPEDFREWIGQPAPDVEFAALDGSRWKLSELRGRRVVVDFWATWCPPCVQEIPHFIRLRREVATNDLVVIGVSGEHAAILQPFLRSRGVSYPIVSSAGKVLPAPFGTIRGLPTTFLIDRSGRFRETLIGYHDFETLHRAAIMPEPDAPAEDLPKRP